MVQAATISPLSNSKPSTRVLQECQKILHQIDVGLEKMGVIQKELPLPIRKETFTALEREQREMKNAIDWVDKQLNQLLDSVILEPQEMHLLLQMQSELFQRMKQLELYNQELINFQKENSLPRYSFLIISDSKPCPCHCRSTFP
jgi:NifB/MoaA-like Fe-S oxidoreductase